MPVSILDMFQGLATFFMVEPSLAIARVLLIVVGFGLVFLGYKQVLDPIIMIPMGIGMVAVNAGVLQLAGRPDNLYTSCNHCTRSRSPTV